MIENTDEDDELNDPLVENTFRTDVIDSDSESIDSDQEEPLKHAGIYTPEEVSAILRDKMTRLQSLYVDELNYLQYLLKEKYKKYINTVRNQQDIFQFSPFKLTNGDLPSDDYKKLKAMMRYHRYHGSEALLKMQVKEKRNKLQLEMQLEEQQLQINASQNSNNNGLALIDASSNLATKSKSIQLCIYEKDNEKCDRRAMPLTHYCKIRMFFFEFK